MGYKTLFEQIKTVSVCAWNSLTRPFFAEKQTLLCFPYMLATDILHIGLLGLSFDAFAWRPHVGLVVQ